MSTSEEEFFIRPLFFYSLDYNFFGQNIGGREEIKDSLKCLCVKPSPATSRQNVSQ